MEQRKSVVSCATSQLITPQLPYMYSFVLTLNVFYWFQFELQQRRVMMFAVGWSSFQILTWRGGCFVGSCRRSPSGLCCCLCSCMTIPVSVIDFINPWSDLGLKPVNKYNDLIFCVCEGWRSSFLLSTVRSSRKKCGCINSIVWRQTMCPPLLCL